MFDGMFDIRIATSSNIDKIQKLQFLNITFTVGHMINIPQTGPAF